MKILGMNKEIKKLFCPLTEVKFDDESSRRGHFSGYGSVFGEIDLGNDIVEKGAFSETLQEWGQKGQLPQMFWYHNNEEIIGEWTKMVEDEKGLYVEGKLWINGENRLETSVKAYNVIKSNSVKGLSIGYSVSSGGLDYQEQADGTVIRKLKKVKLFELSIAPWAMLPQASVTAVKSMIDNDGNVLSKREVEKILRDSGLSKRQSQAFIARGYEGIERDAKTELESIERDAQFDLSGVLESLKKLSSTIQG